MHILIVDKQSIFIAGIASVLSPLIPEMNIRGVERQQDIEKTLDDFPASLILLDGDGNKNESLHMLDELACRYPDIPVVMLINQCHPSRMRMFLRHRAVSAVCRDSPAVTIAQTLRAAELGMQCFPQDTLHALNSPMEAASKLSERQREILKLLAAGESNKQISRHLNISAGTVKAHLESIFRRLNVTNRTQAAMLWPGQE